MALTKQDIGQIKQMMDERFADFFKQMVSLLSHYPTRTEVKDIISDATKDLATKKEVNELKDEVAELRDEIRIQGAFTDNRITTLENLILNDSN